MKQCETAGVMFKRAGKIYDFSCQGLSLNVGDMVVVESDKGEDIARVATINDKNSSMRCEHALKAILRRADENDIKNHERNQQDEPKAFEVCKKMAMTGSLEMKLLSAEYSLDRSKLTFYFTADGRVDFRQLVRDLARVFRTRIEMRQIGVRDATKMTGGFGVCGREFCCSCFLRRFDNISIKMAKNQNLILNPNKISGVCGRLMCCLMYEKDQYGYMEGCKFTVNEAESGDFIELDDDVKNLAGEDK